ncbi:PRA1 family protein (macronuclear) [Tetrahymena thermophila SB210]|uniref:PRA1 family protein n=1 Tax=Tetrahymena thermophila (strain SB210) TaxID=312017 RepID=W7XH51_TETTS|nr:PRA1 family protein [Tetrahymena thermophila SB210]EWS72334.1 PRA1 family protein [Tetrahymena thermophila SB210]|eukprot:XP_012655111.1 PRA1 family protein [Tetrahymena thermophila SB210]
MQSKTKIVCLLLIKLKDPNLQIDQSPNYYNNYHDSIVNFKSNTDQKKTSYLKFIIIRNNNKKYQLIKKKKQLYYISNFGRSFAQNTKMVSRYRQFALQTKNFIDQNFKPFSELIDCRRYNFPKQSILKRFLKNMDYFSYNYLAMALITTILYLVYNIWFIVGWLLTIGFWGVAYKFRQKIIEESPNDMCYNVKMTFFLIINITMIWTAYGVQFIEYIGFIMFPILLHSILFEPVEISNQLPQIISNPSLDVEAQHVNQIPPSQNSSVNYNQISIQESSSQIINVNNKQLSDEQVQAYQHVIQVEKSTNQSNEESQNSAQ